MFHSHIGRFLQRISTKRREAIGHLTLEISTGEDLLGVRDELKRFTNLRALHIEKWSDECYTQSDVWLEYGNQYSAIIRSLPSLKELKVLGMEPPDDPILAVEYGSSQLPRIKRVNEKVKKLDASLEEEVAARASRVEWFGQGGLTCKPWYL